MKIQKLPSGSYRIRKMINGRTISLVFDHKPTQREILTALSDEIDNIAPKTTFKACAYKYVDIKSNVLSPSVVKLYTGYIESTLPEWFLKTKINEISQVHIQTVINDYSVGRKPKTVYNLHGFITATIGMFRPNMKINTTLPQNQKYEPYVPSTEEVKRIIEAVKGTKYHIPFQLGCLGMRRGEVCALSLSDIQGNIVKINKAVTTTKNDGWIVKPIPKTEDSNREIYIPDELVEEIKEAGCIYDGFPNSLLKALHRYQKKLGIQSFRFHDLRHYYASYAHARGMSDADIMQSGGWKTDSVMKSVYRHAMKESLQENQRKIASDILT